MDVSRGVTGLHRHAQQRQTGGGEHPGNQFIQGPSSGTVVALVVQFKGDDGADGFEVAHQKINVLAVHSFGEGAVLPVVACGHEKQVARSFYPFATFSNRALRISQSGITRRSNS